VIGQKQDISQLRMATRDFTYMGQEENIYNGLVEARDYPAIPRTRKKLWVQLWSGSKRLYNVQNSRRYWTATESCIAERWNKELYSCQEQECSVHETLTMK
jgi:hypothetical protein